MLQKAYFFLKMRIKKESKKKIFMIILFLVLIYFSVLCSGYSSKSDYGDVQLPGSVCCKKTNNGEWCQQVPESKCASSQKAPTNCDNTDYCKIGTCINIEEGNCMENVPYSLCIEEGGNWKDKLKEEIPECQLGCCMMGEEYALVTKAKCLEMSSDYGIKINFREDIISQGECAAATAESPRGACIIESEYETACTMSLRDECLEKKDSREYLSELTNPTSNVKVEFQKGKLCTNKNLNTDCAPTEKTTCYNDKIYFLDSCGNRANVYDSLKIDNQEYWDFIQNPDCGPVSSSSSKGVKKTCGDCSYLKSTKCQNPKSDDPEPEMGEYVCGDLSCEYDTNGDGRIDNDEEYLNGESWCAETKGTVHHIKVDENGNILEEDFKKLINQEEYNLPGSEYVKLTCSEGEVLESHCNSRRREICTEYELKSESFTVAQCSTNYGTQCTSITNKGECVNTSMCKWLPGLRFDQEIIKGENERIKEQGSCVPLVAPGIEFWNPKSSSKSTCILGNSPSVAFYEVHWMESREKMGKGEWDQSKKAANCFKGTCAAIPYYGQKADGSYSFVEGVDRKGMREVWEGNKNPDDLVASKRQGHYCHKSEKDEKFKTGGTSGKVGCLKDKDKRNEPPIFLTHADFMNFLRVRARSLGDCGIKDNIAGDKGSGDTETYQHIFQKVKMKKGEAPQVQENITEVEDIYTTEQLIELWEEGYYETYYSVYE